MLQVKTESFVLDKIPGYNDEGKITIFTKKFGILSVVASGLYRPGARLSAWTEPPSLVTADLTLPERDSRNGRLLTLTLKKPFPAFRESYFSASWYYFYLFLLLNFLPQGIKSVFIYNLWKELLNSPAFENTRNRNLGFIYFSTRLLKNQGFYPSFKFCVRCNKNWEAEETVYCYLPGQGLICRDCLKELVSQNHYNNYEYSLDFLGLLPLKNKLNLPEGVLRIRPAERGILEISEKSPQLTDFFANIFSRSSINDPSLKKVRNFLLLFLAPLL